MRKIILYQCGICGTTYNNIEDAEQCEASNHFVDWVDSEDEEAIEASRLIHREIEF